MVTFSDFSPIVVGGRTGRGICLSDFFCFLENFCPEGFLGPVRETSVPV